MGGDNGSNPIDWPLVKLSDLGEVNRGRSRHRPRYAEHLYGGPYPFIQTGDIKQSNGRITRFDQTYSEAGLEQSRMWPKGTMAITIAANIAETAILTFPACFPDSVIGFIADEAKCEVTFVEYMFRHLKRRIQHEATGSVQDNINLGTLERLLFPRPPLPEQRAIANILGTLDDKIELNRRMNETLEGIARALFKSWFVDFDPVRAKMDGRQPAGMSPEIAELFPGELVNCDLLGEIPQGWKTERFAKHMTVSRGLSYKGSGLSEAGIPMHNLNSIYEGGQYKYEGIKYYTGEYREKHLVKPGDLIVTNTEQGFDRLLIGYAAIVPCYFGSRGIFSHHIYRVRIRESSPLSPHYLLHLINSQRWHDWISGFSNGTTINMLPMDAFEMPLLVVPPSALVEQFTEFAIAQSAKTEQIFRENHKLATLRDTLLPKLLSGELRVPQAEKMVEQVL